MCVLDRDRIIEQSGPRAAASMRQRALATMTGASSAQSRQYYDSLRDTLLSGSISDVAVNGFVR